MFKKFEAYTSEKINKIKEKVEINREKQRSKNHPEEKLLQPETIDSNFTKEKELPINKNFKRSNVDRYFENDSNLKCVSGMVKAKINGIKKQMKSDEGIFGLKGMLMKKRESLNAYIRCEIEKIVLIVISKVPGQLKKQLKDPLMFDFVKKIVDDLVDEIWPEIEEEMLYNIRLKIDKPIIPRFPRKNIPLYLIPFDKIRSWYLYTKSPYDISIWGSLRNPSWWIILIVSLVPSFGIQPFIFIINFLMMDKKDEYQLVKYIVEYKRMQFFATGFLGTLFGFIAYFKCSTLTNRHTPIEEILRCNQQGPGSSINLKLDGLGYLLQIILIWASFLLLPFSQEKGELGFERVRKVGDEKVKNIKLFMGKIPYTSGRLNVNIISEVEDYIIL